MLFSTGISSPSSANMSASRVLWALLGIAILHFGLRFWLIQCPSLSEFNYDEAVIALMALEAGQGEFPTFIWGQAYMGPLEAYLALPWTAIFGVNTFSMRLSIMVLSCLLMLMVYACGRYCAGPRAGLLAALFWAVPPLFLGFFTIQLTGGHLVSIAGSTCLIMVCCRLLYAEPPRRGWLWAFMGGVAAGVGFWASQIGAPLTGMAGLSFLLVRPGVLLKTWPYLMGLGFVAGASRFIYWNLTHAWLTFGQVGGHGGSFWHKVQNLIDTVWLPILTGAWWDAASVADLMPGFAPPAVLILIYLPVVLLCIWGMVKWIRRGIGLAWPFKGPLDLVIICLSATLIYHAYSSYGNTIIVRYAMVIIPPLAVLCGVMLARAWRLHWVLGLGLILALISYNLGAHYLYRQVHRDFIPNQAAGVVASLDKNRVTHAYSHARMGLPITAHSGGRIRVADYLGLRNLQLLREADHAPKAALITNRELGAPLPKDMEKALGILGVKGKKVQAGNYIYWHDFPAPPAMTPVPGNSIQVRASGGKGAGSQLVDRNPLTGLKTHYKEQVSLMLSLDREYLLNRVSLLPGQGFQSRLGMAFPLKLESSTDGRSWSLIRQANCMAGMVWDGRRARLGRIPGLQVSFAPQKARMLRITLGVLDKHRYRFGWDLSEVYLYEAKDPGGYPGPEAALAKRLGVKALDAWYLTDPKGPVSFGVMPIVHWRRGLVDWSLAVNHFSRAISLAPDWERPMRLFIESLRKGGLKEYQVAPVWDAAVLDRHGPVSAMPPIKQAGLLLSGQGSYQEGPLPWADKHELSHGSPRLIMLQPAEKHPQFVPLEGQILKQRVSGLPALAAAALEAGQTELGLKLTRRALAAPGLDTAKGLKLASGLARAGHKDLAVKALKKLGDSNLAELKDLAALVQKKAAMEPARLKAWLGLAELADWVISPGFEAEAASVRFGRIVQDSKAQGQKAVQGLPGRDTAGDLKIWFNPHFKKGAYLVRYRLKGHGKVKLMAHRHMNHQYAGLLNEAHWQLKGDAYHIASLPVSLDKQPGKIEAGLHWDGKSALMVDRIWIEPDLMARFGLLVGPLTKLLVNMER